MYIIFDGLKIFGSSLHMYVCLRVCIIGGGGGGGEVHTYTCTLIEMSMTTHTSGGPVY